MIERSIRYRKTTAFDTNFASLRVFIMVNRNPAESSCVNDEIEPKDRDGWQSNHAGRINQILSMKTLQTL